MSGIGRGGGPGVSNPTYIAMALHSAVAVSLAPGLNGHKGYPLFLDDRRAPAFFVSGRPKERTRPRGLVRVKSARPRTSAASRVGTWTVPCQPARRFVRLPDPVRSLPCRSRASGSRNVRRFTIADGINCELPHTISTSRRPGKSGGLWRHIGATRNGNLRPKTDKIAPRRLS